MFSIKVKKAIPQENPKLKVYFSDGKVGICNLANFSSYPLFQHFKDPISFNHVAVDECGGVFWTNGADISAEYLYSIAEWDIS